MISYVTYTVTPYQWHLRQAEMATTKKTPTMLTSHTHWPLDGFQNPNTPLALNNTLQMLYSGQRVAIDNVDIPTGDILANQQYGAQNFWSAPKQLSTNITSPGLLGTCRLNCTGYGTCYPFNRDAQLGGLYDWREAPATTLASSWSGSLVVRLMYTRISRHCRCICATT